MPFRQIYCYNKKMCIRDREYSNFKVSVREEEQKEKEIVEGKEENKEENEVIPLINVYHNIQESLEQQNTAAENNVLPVQEPGDNGFTPSFNQALTCLLYTSRCV